MSLITYDTAQFEADARKYCDLSPVFAELDVLKGLKYPSALVPPDLWNTLPHLLKLVSAACSAVELAKIAIVAEADPDGTKGAFFDKQVQLEVASRIVLGNLHFSGFLGPLINKAWKPIVGLLVCFFVAGQPANWGALAVEILKLVVLA